ncbi:MAG: hypothetical protein IM638_09845 [Bacteroidetes bacterium]|nr:hypothetical protein [Bacteroidota bacterium]
MKRLILFLALLGSLPALAQKTPVPGFLGKRFYVGVNASTFLHFQRNEEDVVQFDNFPLNTRFSYKTEATMSYVLNRKISTGLTVTYAEQKAYFGILSAMVINAPPPIPTDTFVANVRPISPNTEFGRVQYSFYSVQAHIKIFRRNFIAPAGRYHYFAAGILRYQPVTLEKGQIQLKLTDSLYSSIPAFTQPLKNNGAYTTFRLTYAMGRITPLNKFIFLNTSFGINLHLGGDYRKVIIDSAFNSVTTIQDAVITGLYQNLTRHNTFEVKVGLGFYAF